MTDDVRPSQQDQQLERPPLWHLPIEMWGMMRDEWNSRTWWGKALYPLWLVDSAVQWIAFLAFFAFLTTAAWFLRLFNSDREKSGSVLPEVYKNDAER